jgi:calcineurin-like phosphoesterase family protein
MDDSVSSTWFVALLIGLMLLAVSFPSDAAAESNVSLIPAAGPPGTQISLLGRHFGKHDRVIVRAGKQTVAMARTNRRGTFRASFAVPERGPGVLRIVSRSRGRRVVGLFGVSAPPSTPAWGEVTTRRGRRLLWNPTDAPVGSVVEVRGSQFPPNRLLRIRFGGQPAGMLRTDRRGKFSTVVTVPDLSAGPHRVRFKLRARALGFIFDTTPTSNLGSHGTPGVAPVGASGTSPTPLGPDAIVYAAGDIACAPGDSTSSTTCRDAKTSDIIVGGGGSAALALGDLQYNSASLSNLRASYDRSWGRVKSITRPALGNHESSGNGYFDYFNGSGAANGPAGPRGKGYYSYDAGTWHLIALNSNCARVACNAGSPQEQWLRADLAANPKTCTLAYWHHARFSSGYDGDNTFMQDLWNDLYNANADLVLAGHSHDYERYAPMNAGGGLDRTRGIREFVVGTGGAFFTGISNAKPNSEVRQNNTFGVLKLTLHPAGYDWQFVPEAGKTFKDGGSQACH